MKHRIETPEERHTRGLRMSADDFADLAHLRGIEARLTEEQLVEFRALFNGADCRGIAGVRPAADLALQVMLKNATEAIMGKDAKKSWRATG